MSLTMSRLGMMKDCLGILILEHFNLWVSQGWPVDGWCSSVCLPSSTNPWSSCCDSGPQLWGDQLEDLHLPGNGKTIIHGFQSAVYCGVWSGPLAGGVRGVRTIRPTGGWGPRSGASGRHFLCCCVARMLTYGTCKRSCQSALWPKLHSLSWVIVSKMSEKGNGQLRVAEAWIRAIP